MSLSAGGLIAAAGVNSYPRGPPAQCCGGLGAGLRNTGPSSSASSRTILGVTILWPPGSRTSPFEILTYPPSAASRAALAPRTRSAWALVCVAWVALSVSPAAASSTAPFHSAPYILGGRVSLPPPRPPHPPPCNLHPPPTRHPAPDPLLLPRLNDTPPHRSQAGRAACGDAGVLRLRGGKPINGKKPKAKPLTGGAAKAAAKSNVSSPHP